MKKRWKIFLIADGAILALGILICLVAWIAGDRPEYTDFRLFDDEWSVKNFGRLYDGDTGNVISDGEFVEIDAIELSCKMGELTLRGSTGADRVEVSGNGIHTDLVIEERDGRRVLTVKDGKSSLGELDICIPQNKKLEYIRTSVGAGNLELENLAAKELKVKVGTGDASLYNVTSDAAVLDCGMGDIDFEHSGLGKLDFNYDLTCKAGEVEIDGASYSGINFSEKIENGANRNMKISCKMGNVNLEFGSTGRTGDDYDGEETYEDRKHHTDEIHHEEHEIYGKGDF